MHWCQEETNALLATIPALWFAWIYVHLFCRRIWMRIFPPPPGEPREQVTKCNKDHDHDH
jgi:hypothetical protein